jgi:TatD DNase family protein
VNLLFDTHAHFESQDDIAAILARAAAAGVGAVMAVGGSQELNEGALKARKLGCRALALGWDRDQLDVERPPIDYTDVNAVGEIGLDYYYDGQRRAEQRELFAGQLELAARLNKPVVIHTRQADDDTIGLLREIPSRGIIHCFTGSPEFCRQLLDLGFMISISGIVTFRLADNVRQSALVIPDDRILIETDSPYLAPVPKRGKRNEPCFLKHTADFLADLRNTPREEFVELTRRNAERMLCTDL